MCLCLDLDVPVSLRVVAVSRRIWDSGVLVSLPSGICRTLEKISLMAVLCISGFDMDLGDMAYSRSSDVDWTQCTSSLFPYDISTSEVSIFPSRSVSWIFDRSADGKTIGDCFIPTSPVVSVPENLTQLRATQAPVRRWVYR